ncbi:hypothetical protein ACFOY2_46105 [Nonomuraea purpurea]|uniref:Uncharacterized protein n=1 Tax=Nonomuraea purpurea TaxID=1849276 RepID=A0ABV8GQQ8_9ACTN
MTTLARITSRYMTGHEYKALAEAIPAVPARYGQMAELIGRAADAYHEAATLAGIDPKGLEERKILRRFAESWLNQIDDPYIMTIAIGADFPAHLATVVSVKALRGWLTKCAYGSGPRLDFGGIIARAQERYNSAFPDLVACEQCDEIGDHTASCTIELSIGDDVDAAMAEVVHEEDLPGSWQFAPVHVIRTLAANRARMVGLTRIAVEAKVPAAVPPRVEEFLALLTP